MTLDPALEETVDRMLDALRAGDVAGLVACYDPADAARFQRRLLDLARRLEPLGEAAGLLALLGVGSASELAAADPRGFISRLLSAAFQAIAVAPDAGDLVVVGLEQPGPEDAALTYAVGPEGARYERSVRLQRRGPAWFLRFENEALERRIAAMEAWVAEFQARSAAHREHADAPEELEPFAVWGYRNQAGEVVIAPRFSKAGDFHDGLAPVRLLSQWGYVDVQGRLAIPARFVRAREFQEGLAAAAVGDRLAPRWGFIDPGGAWAIEPAFEEVESFSQGLAAAKPPDGAWGYIDRTGAWVIEPRFEAATSFDEDERAAVELDGEHLLIDRWGNPIAEDEDWS